MGTFTLAHNQFSHMTEEEFNAKQLGFKPRPADEVRETNHFTGAAPPTSWDWAPKGAVTPVKNQGQCGSCWAFSTTGSMEGAHFIKTGSLISFSEQQIVDCDIKGDDQGCNGGLMDNAFKWIKSNGGVCKEADYPYKGRQGGCQTTCTPIDNTVPNSWTDVAATTEALTAAVAQQPVSIAIDAGGFFFQFYSSGVYSRSCKTDLDHGVLAVGYGTWTDGKTEYWKVKNSWAATWGMKGFILLEKAKPQTGGQCGILLSASYPTV